MLKKKILGIIAIMVAILLLPTVYADKYTDEMDKVAPNGELVINSIPPRNETEMYYIVHEFPFYNLDGSYRFDDSVGTLGVDNVSNDFKSAKLILYKMGDRLATRDVTIKYNYKEDIYNKISEWSKKIPENQPIYYISDLEVINFWVNGKEDNYDNIDNYSTELKSVFKNSNLEFRVENRAGFLGTIAEGRMGIATIMYDNTLYYCNPALGTQTHAVIYVDDDETDVVKAAQKRINDYVGHDKYVITEDSTVREYVDAYIQQEKDYYHEWYEREKNSNLSNEEYLSSYESFLLHYGIDEDNITSEELDFLADYMSEKIYKVTINGEVRKFLIIKDKKGMKNPTFGSLDLGTDVSVTSDNTTIPLDTLINANKLTSGDTYDKIRKVVTEKNTVTYDIQLYSKSIANNIKKLENGKFLVSIPVPKEMEGKELTVYYVAQDGTKEEHKVTVKDGYALFETDHFSTYTLVAKEDSNPPTGDNILSMFITFIICAVGFVIVLKKANE